MEAPQVYIHGVACLKKHIKYIYKMLIWKVPMKEEEPVVRIIAAAGEERRCCWKETGEFWVQHVAMSQEEESKGSLKVAALSFIWEVISYAEWV